MLSSSHLERDRISELLTHLRVRLSMRECRMVLMLEPRHDWIEPCSGQARVYEVASLIDVANVSSSRICIRDDNRRFRQEPKRSADQERRVVSLVLAGQSIEFQNVRRPSFSCHSLQERMAWRRSVCTDSYQRLTSHEAECKRNRRDAFCVVLGLYERQRVCTFYPHDRKFFGGIQSCLRSMRIARSSERHSLTFAWFGTCSTAT